MMKTISARSVIRGLWIESDVETEHDVANAKAGYICELREVIK